MLSPGTGNFREIASATRTIWQSIRCTSPEPLTSEALSELTLGLNRVARNLWWTWDEGAQEIFQELSPRGWQNHYHNAVAVLHEVSEQELRMRLGEPGFAEKARKAIQAFD